MIRNRTKEHNKESHKAKGESPSTGSREWLTPLALLDISPTTSTLRHTQPRAKETPGWV